MFTLHLLGSLEFGPSSEISRQRVKTLNGNIVANCPNLALILFARTKLTSSDLMLFIAKSHSQYIVKFSDLTQVHPSPA